MYVSDNGIIWLIESVCLGPKVIPLSDAHCIKNNCFNSWRMDKLPTTLFPILNLPKWENIILELKKS